MMCYILRSSVDRPPKHRLRAPELMRLKLISGKLCCIPFRSLFKLSVNTYYYFNCVANMSDVYLK